MRASRIGCLHIVKDQLSQPIAFYVRDNDRDTCEKHYDAIFRISKRLHGRTIFGGGIGASLTIVKRIVERHGGTFGVNRFYAQGQRSTLRSRQEEIEVW